MHNQGLVTNNDQSLYSRSTEGIESKYIPTIKVLMSVDKKVNKKKNIKQYNVSAPVPVK